MFVAEVALPDIDAEADPDVDDAAEAAFAFNARRSINTSSSSPELAPPSVAAKMAADDIEELELIAIV